MGKQTFAEELKTYQRTQGKTWFNSLSADVQRELLDVRAKHLSGEITVPKRVIYRLACEKFSLPCKLTTFRDWLRGEGNG